MSDLQLAVEIVRQITSAVDRILHRFESVPSSSFFLDSEAVFEVCKENLSPMLPVLKQMVSDLNA